MKTITLTEEAYERPKVWKKAGKDSFSNVVLRLVPEKGTWALLGRDVAALPPLEEESFKVMEEAAEFGGRTDE